MQNKNGQYCSIFVKEDIVLLSYKANNESLQTQKHVKQTFGSSLLLKMLKMLAKCLFLFYLYNSYTFFPQKPEYCIFVFCWPNDNDSLILDIIYDLCDILYIKGNYFGGHTSQRTIYSWWFMVILCGSLPL